MRERESIPQLETLESRAMLTTTVLSVTVSPQTANAGSNVVATLDATSNLALRAASFFRDVNANGRWDAGVDQALGDSFSQVAPGRFQRTFRVGPDWPRNVSIIGNAVDTGGSWGTPRAAALTVNRAPQLTGLTISPGQSEPGFMVDALIDSTSDLPLRAATLFRDVNRNGRWDAGTDEALGESRAQIEPGRFLMSLLVFADWDISTQLVANVVNTAGVWGAGRAATLTVGSPPVVNNVTISPGYSNVGTSVTVTAEASSSRTLLAATFFRDVNSNGVWDAGVDQPLGDSFTPVGLGRFQKSILIGADWSSTTSIVANVVDTGGRWGTPLAQTLGVNRRPVVTTGYIADLFPEIGDTIRVYAAGTDDVAIDAMTAFIDVDRNARWTPGVDRWLADDFEPDNLGVFEFALTVQSNWPSFTDIVIEALDTGGLFSGQPLLAGTVRVNSAPVLSALTYTASDVSASEPFNPLQLTATVTDDTTVSLVSFWLDLNSNGTWDAGTDQFLGESRARTPNTNNFSVRVLTDLAGLASATIAARALDADGKWSTVRTVQASLPRLPQVLQFSVDSANAGYFLSADAWMPPAGVQASAQVPRVRFVADTNFNGVQDAGDVLIAVVAPTGVAPTGWRHDYRLSLSDIGRLPVDFQWLAVPVFLGSNSQDVLGAPRWAFARVVTAQEPRVTQLTATVGLDALGNAAPATVGNFFRASAVATAPGGIHAITFFWDRDLNGRWDSGLDIDLGFGFAGGGSSETVQISGLITQAMSGPGAIAAAAKSDVVGGALWSAPFSARVDRVQAGPELSISDGWVSSGIFTLELNVTDDFGAARVTGYIDADHDGLDADDAPVVFTRFAGNSRSGGWRATINAVGVPANTVLYVVGVDFYRGNGGQGLSGPTLEVEIPSPW